MNTKQMTDYYKKRGFSDESLTKALGWIKELEAHIVPETTTIDKIKDYINILVKENENSLDRILAIARYFYLIDRKDIYIYFTAVLGGLGVIDSIKERTFKQVGAEMTDKIFDGFDLPPLGTSLDIMPDFTAELINRFEKHLPKETYHKILAGNNHGVSADPSLKEKEIYEKLGDLDIYLKDRHKRKVEELQKHCDEKKVWFEQIITQEVVDFVAENQEILSGKRDGDTLYITKIPYDTKAFIEAKDDLTKRYYACHCSFAREAILNSDGKVPGDWCYCSAGFAKFPFEVILGKELDIEVLENALDGDMRCRFAIKL